MRMTDKSTSDRDRFEVRGSVMPTAIAAATVITVAMLGLVALWEQMRMDDLRYRRLRQAHADAGSAYLLYCLHPDDERLTAAEGFLLYDSIPKSRVYLSVRPWGLYELVDISTADSAVRQCRLTGIAPSDRTLCYTDNRTALNIAGGTRLRGTLYLPQNGLVYGRMGSEFYDGETVPASAIRRSAAEMPRPEPQSVEILQNLLARTTRTTNGIPRSVQIPLSADSTLFLAVGSAEIADCSLSGRIVITGDEIRIDSACCMRNVIVCARKATVGAGAHIGAQIIVRDTAIIEPRAALQYPSGIYAGRYAELGDCATLDGYAIVCDTTTEQPATASYRQSPTARLRGLLYVDGTAEVRGHVTGFACLRRAAYFSPHGYYKDMLYDADLRENPVTAHPIWIADSAARRKEVVCTN